MHKFTRELEQTSENVKKKLPQTAIKMVMIKNWTKKLKKSKVSTN